MEHRNEFPIEKMCKVLQVSKSGFYRWLKSGPSKRDGEHKLLTEQIRKIHKQSHGTYGSPRITRELNDLSVKVSRPRVARLMRKANIRSKIQRKYAATTDSNHSFKIAENLLDRNFEPGVIRKAWVSDITYIRTGQGWLYLTTVIDLGDRKVIGWALSTSLKAEHTSIAACKMAVTNRPVSQDMIFHSDRGVQYACTEFKDLLKSYKTVRQSMSRKGNCWDNAVAESFFKSLKSEWTRWRKYQSINEAKISVFQYIEAWYNTKRRHSALQYMTPLEFEHHLLTQKLAA